MNARPLWLAGLALPLLLGGRGAEADAPGKDQQARDVQALAKKIDEQIEKRWGELKQEPAAQASDAEFMRRVYVDLAGRIPSVAEARAFLADKRADKRARLVDKILASPRYVTHFTNVWRQLLIPEAGQNFLVKLQQGGFEAWLKKRVARNAGYDEMARDLVTAPLPQGINAFASLAGGDESPLAFYSAKEFKSENLAAGTARIFLGVSVECAQCHNHPFADWKREQFWSFAAFYSGIRSQQLMDFILPAKEVPDQHELKIPGTETTVQAKFLDGVEPEWKPQGKTRATLADWLTAPENPYFARAGVNRLWAYFMGTGLVEPVDEMVGTSVTASHPELLDLLAKEFANQKFDVKFIIRAITSSRAYQLTSAGKKGGDDPALFARMPPRGLTPEQLFDSVAMATGYRDAAGDEGLLAAITGGNKSARAEFLTKFANPSQRSVDAQTSILQALTLMNGKLVADATSLERSETLAAIVEAPFASTGERIEALYLATLSRTPTTKEVERATRFIDNATRGAAEGKEHRVAYTNALADVFWAVLNSSEFILNH